LVCTALIERKLLRLPAVGGHYVYIEVAVVLAGESNPFPIRRKFREKLAAFARSDASRHASRSRSQPQISAVKENDLVFVNIGKTHQAAFLRFLGDQRRARQ